MKEATRTGLLIVNADDWGRDRETTDKTLDCILRGTVSSVSAMVFMEDSERAAAIGRQHGIDAGLHLNFTTPFSAVTCPGKLLERQAEIAKYLSRNPLARGVFNPWLARSFEYVASAQRDEYCRNYGKEPERYDGHHHMHLSANVLLGGLLPKGSVVRRHFSYESREKALRNRVFRRTTDLLLTRKYRVVDHLFSFPPLDPPGRLQRIFALARHSLVEVETHPVHPEEYKSLLGDDIVRWTRDCPIAAAFTWDRKGNRAGGRF